MKEPLYIRILTGVGAWFSAIFIIAFLGISNWLDDGAIIIGIFFLIGAVLTGRSSKTIFLRQLALALAFCGNLLVLYGTTHHFHFDFNLPVLVSIQAIVCFVMYPLLPSPVYRFIAPIGLVSLLVAWIVDFEIFTAMHILTAGTMLLAGVLVLRKEKPRSLTPLTYSAAAMLPAALLFMNLTQLSPFGEHFRGPLWPSSVILAIGLIYLYIHLAGGADKLRQPWFILAVACTILLGVFTTPGVLVVVGLFILGFAFQDVFLSGLGYIFLPCFLILFYYAMNIDLAYKSYVVAGSGVVFLVVRWLASYCSPKGAIQ